MEAVPARSGLNGIPYFAYGSNLHPEQMEAWAPSARILGPARLPGFRLAFLRRSIRWEAGAADVVASPGDEVWGALYDVEDLARLDEKEYVADGGYRRLAVTVHAPHPVEAITYEVVDKAPHHLPPKPEYLALLVDGARARGLPAHWVDLLSTTKGAP